MADLNLALPHDLIVEILLRLPVSSLVRFKCVCTSWRSLISHPKFGKSHFDRDPSPTHRLLLYRFDDDSAIQSLDIEASFDDPSAFANLKLPKAPYFETLGSSRGLILLTKDKYPSLDDLIVWNPSTGSHREITLTYSDWDSWHAPLIPARPNRPRRAITPYNILYDDLYGFGYDPSKDDYLLVVMRLSDFAPEVEQASPPRIVVLSLKTNSPSFYGYDEVDYVLRKPWFPFGVYLNHSLHWFATSMATDLEVVIAFDLVERSLSEIPFSTVLAEELRNYHSYKLSVLGGCLCLCYSGEALTFPDCWGRHERTEIWVMKEYNVPSSWTISYVLYVHPTTWRFLPIWLTEDGGVLGSDHNGALHKFNDEEELLETFGLEDKYGPIYFDMYRETLLPLPGDFEEENEDA